MGRKPVKSLVLCKETLRTLSQQQLRAVDGRGEPEAGEIGVYTDPCTPWCSIPSHYICCA